MDVVVTHQANGHVLRQWSARTHRMLKEDAEKNELLQIEMSWTTF